MTPLISYGGAAPRWVGSFFHCLIAGNYMRCLYSWTPYKYFSIIVIMIVFFVQQILEEYI